MVTTLVGRDAQGSFAGQVITAESKYCRNCKQKQVQINNGWFNNLTVGTLTLASGTTIPITGGGTGAS
jgi:hypothetical protein